MRSPKVKARTPAFPKWILHATVGLIVLMLFLAGISDADGRLRPPGMASYIFLAVVAAGAVAVGFIDRKRRLAEDRPQSKDRRSRPPRMSGFWFRRRLGP
jgi:hypothetical protein